jgi:hypothetical protein
MEWLSEASWSTEIQGGVLMLSPMCLKGLGWTLDDFPHSSNGPREVQHLSFPGGGPKRPSKTYERLYVDQDTKKGGLKLIGRPESRVACRCLPPKALGIQNDFLIPDGLFRSSRRLLESVGGAYSTVPGVWG